MKIILLVSEAKLSYEDIPPGQIKSSMYTKRDPYNSLRNTCLLSTNLTMCLFVEVASLTVINLLVSELTDSQGGDSVGILLGMDYDKLLGHADQTVRSKKGVSLYLWIVVWLAQRLWGRVNPDKMNVSMSSQDTSDDEVFLDPTPPRHATSNMV
uniref:Uncharacterized protein n=1 Tax=Timema bartmani TaxID=61472 RepID=A0A7R9EVX8_9NEOP|nr:unnamed protein product [Timema bartmani]